jgi:hypothetical protein
MDNPSKQIYTGRRKTKEEHNTICIGHHHKQTNTNNVNNTWVFVCVRPNNVNKNINVIMHRILKGCRMVFFVFFNLSMQYAPITATDASWILAIARCRWCNIMWYVPKNKLFNWLDLLSNDLKKCESWFFSSTLKWWEYHFPISCQASV